MTIWHCHRLFLFQKYELENLDMSVEDEIARTKLRLAALEKQKAAARDDSDSDIECIEV